MRITKAVITAAAPDQRTLVMQTIIDQNGVTRSVLGILLDEVLRARVEEICVVVRPGDQEFYAKILGNHAARLRFLEQSEPLGYAHAVFCARDFVKNEPFLHLVGDHVYVNRGAKGCAEQLVDIAATEECAVSGVQITREHLLPHYGAIGGQRVPGREGLYQVDTVIEKPSPTEAEQKLIIPGLRAGHYLCFFGMHVLTPSVMDILESRFSAGNARAVSLSSALAELAQREVYLAMNQTGRRFDVGTKYGMLTAQLALALTGCDRDQVLSELLELVAMRDSDAPSRGSHA